MTARKREKFFVASSTGSGLAEKKKRGFQGDWLYRNHFVLLFEGAPVEENDPRIQTEDGPKAEAVPAVTPPSPLLGFLGYLRGSKEFEPLRKHVRVLPKGLFVETTHLDQVVDFYRRWLEVESEGVNKKTLEKCKQRLFEGREPHSEYVIEGKNVLLGILIEFPVKQPQQFGIPFYLGSLMSPKSYLHPGDPILHSLRGTEVKLAGSGVTATVTTRGRALKVEQSFLTNFSRLAEHSRFLQRRHPDMSRSLAETFAVLVSIVRRSRVIRNDLPILIPNRFHNKKNATLRVAGKFLLVEEQGVLRALYEYSGRNLSEFVQYELQAGPKEKLGSFRLAGKRDRFVGLLQCKDGRYQLAPRAFSEFIDKLHYAKDARERFSKPYTVQDCFEKFNSFFQLSAIVERRRLEPTVTEWHLDQKTFRLHNGWVFAISQSGVLERVIARHIRGGIRSRRR